MANKWGNLSLKTGFANSIHFLVRQEDFVFGEARVLLIFEGMGKRRW
jgi:hypothetical protein